MYNHFALFHSIKELETEFEVSFPSISKHSIYSPSQTVLTISDNKELKASLMGWGLIPYWARHEGVGNKMAYARAETIETKRSFKFLLQKNRCIIPASCFYKWRQTKNGTKHPYKIELLHQEIMAFAGLWDTWKNLETNQTIYSCTIITSSTSGLTLNRAPVLLTEGNRQAWLDSSITNQQQLMSLLKPIEKNSFILQKINHHNSNETDLFSTI
ncbi:SOS response-associated peptidase [Shouchella hunanensis]|uniref:Abasic site processing protein n=1 Tax=Shouchella hunanensis TaxID=766894 RepID=A0ABY7WCG2_9BACI|nr:SOS response-associated peptidase [Shouchella hunanensis]WDF05806.1 SOS response-associated peptidase [Shouchella hunanensis]